MLERMGRVKQLLPLMIVLAALVIVDTPATANEPTGGQQAATTNIASSDEQYEPMGAGDAADDAARQAKDSSRDGAARYASALDAARNTNVDGNAVAGADQAIAATSDNNVSSAQRADKHEESNQQNSSSDTRAVAPDQYPNPPDEDSGLTTQAARDAAEEAASSAKESSEKEAAAYAAALEAARSTGASETAASIAATEAVADTEDTDTGTDSGKTAKDSADIDVLPATGGVSPLVAVAISLVIAGGLLTCGLHRR